jgi:hypothetical protein
VYVVDSSSSVLHAESAFCMVFGGFRTLIGPNFLFGIRQRACVAERISDAQIPRTELRDFRVFSCAPRRDASYRVNSRALHGKIPSLGGIMKKTSFGKLSKTRARCRQIGNGTAHLKGLSPDF